MLALHLMEDILLVHRKSNRNFSEELVQRLGNEGAIWQTCLRKILFCTEETLNAHAELLEEGDHVLRGEKALSLLLEILCGLHSPIVGETEVFGQFKTFVETRQKMQDILFGDHQKWLHFIMAEVKKTRAEHLVGIGSQSYGSLIRRHTKSLDSVTLCGSGQLAQEILPWVSHKKSLQVICRKPSKMQNFAEKYSHLNISTYNNSYIHGEALVIAAPLSDEQIMELMHKQETRPQAIFDLRGEQNELSSLLVDQFPQVSLTSLHQFFAEIEETKKDTQDKLQTLKQVLLEKSMTFMQRLELRPHGWDDLCS